MSFNFQNAVGVLQNIDEIWQGYRYTLFPVSIDPSQLGIALANISDVQFPSIQVQYTTVPTLSTIEKKIPSKIVYGDLTLKACIVRDNEFYIYMQDFVDVLTGDQDYKKVNARDLILAEYGAPNAINVIPINMWLLKNCQPTSFTPGPANSNSESMPLDELVLHVDRITKL